MKATPAAVDRYLQTKVAVKNFDGSRGWDRGVRIFDCPLCRENKARGWVSVDKGAAGCLNGGCPAQGGLRGGVLEWVRLLEGYRTKAEAFVLLQTRFGGEELALGGHVSVPVQRGADWVKMPKEFQLIGAGGVLELRYVSFAQRQWGVDVRDLVKAGTGYCVEGRHAKRLILPITIGEKAVAFLARSIVNKQPKYLTSSYGEKEDPRAECGRPARALLYGIDAVDPGDTVVLVEGAGDVLRFNKDTRDKVAVALLGTELTAEKAALLTRAQPRQIVVALDNEPQATARAALWAYTLKGFGLDARLGRWHGAKDSGSGAILEVT